MLAPVSVIVVNYNGKDYLPSCLDSVFSQDPAEVLLVDSGSTDGAADRAARDYPLRLLSLGENLGPSAARNLGLREAKHDLVLLIDNDVELTPGCLDRLCVHLEANDDLAMIQARSLLGSVDGPVHYDGGTFHYVGLIALRNWYRPQQDLASGAAGLDRVDVAISLCCLARRERLVACGGFDERMFILFEDLACSYALRLKGYRVAVAGDAICLHKAGTAGLSTRGPAKEYAARRSFLHSRNRWIFVLTHYRWRSLVLLFPGFAVYGVVHLGFVVASGHLGAWLRGKRELWRLRGYLRARRRRIQDLRSGRGHEAFSSPALTFNPGLAGGPARRFVRSGLDGVLGLWFWCVKWAL